MTNESSDQELADMIGQTVTLHGTTGNSKGGAVLITLKKDIVFIEDLASWEDDLVGKDIVVTGLLKRVKYIPDPAIDEDGAISQGAEGLQYVLKNAHWRNID